MRGVSWGLVVSALLSAAERDSAPGFREAEDGAVEMDTRQCPLCDRFCAGFPRRLELCGGDSTAHWPEGVRWLWRMDLRSWVCPRCHAELGPDTVRLAALAERNR